MVPAPVSLVTVPDVLPHRGNLEKRASVGADPGYTFVRGNIYDAELLDV